ncbi:hypothetical protein GP2143_07324 [marine gamma proteobacterium HTCC2143]|jgi:hypothetical protein|uniref:Uncharacterized protein n=1 Tax=marine gamma proteobacterium HTCC2143 TaxID=247633 RepID=A0YC22_9GAMM|nr:hypothetical protein GP2143_07324 [marine gamma proteobacterium HTCC2143]
MEVAFRLPTLLGANDQLLPVDNQVEQKGLIWRLRTLKLGLTQ